MQNLKNDLFMPGIEGVISIRTNRCKSLQKSKIRNKTWRQSMSSMIIQLTLMVALQLGLVAGVSAQHKDRTPRAFATTNKIPQEKTINQSQDIDTDRWCEIDLYWFDKNNPKESAEKFWKRLHPLYDQIKGWKGIIINVGWSTGYVLDWRGELDDTIPIPRGMMHSRWVPEHTGYSGTLVEKYAQFHERFSMVGTDPQEIIYQKWTYRDLKNLCDFLHQTAKDKYGFVNVKIGTFVYGVKRIYGGDASKWSIRHPESYSNFNGNISFSNFNPAAKLKADTVRYGAYPNGIPMNLPLYDFFGRQWGDFSKDVGLDAIVFRDRVLGPGKYDTGPFGNTLSPDTTKNNELMQAAANLVKVTKQSNPNALVISYSHGGSGVADWMIYAANLGAIAKQGYLDAFIDQTWSGAWNELGMRSFGFWNCPSRGWTTQMAFMLIHGAVLAGTKVKHYHLTETFDAWESWDVIHTAPQRLKWGIWAYSHAAIKTPDGIKMPNGTYISWCNKGKELLPEKDVQFLQKNLDEAYRNAAQVDKVYGPTLVYNRSGLEWQVNNAPSQDIKQWIDEYAGILMKWGIPIMSATKMEWLDEIKTDLPILQTPNHLHPKEQEYILNQMDNKEPFMIIGSPAGGISPAIAQKGSLLSNAKEYKETRYGLIPSKNNYSSNLDTLFSLLQNFTLNRPVGNVKTLYSAIDTIPTNGKTVLTLVVKDGGKDYRGDYDHTDWANARLITHSGKVIYLSDLKPVVSNTDFIHFTNNTNVIGGPISIDGINYAKGVGMHANGEVVYHLEAGKYNEFKSIVGLDDRGLNRGQVIAKVYINGTLAFNSGILNKNNQSGNVSVSIPKKGETVTPVKSPVLTITTDERRILTWDPPKYIYRWYVPMFNNLGGSLTPYVLTARATSDLLEGTNSPLIKNIEPHKTVWMGAWQLQNGIRQILTADLEEGITFGIHEETAHSITLPKNWGSNFEIKDMWHNSMPEVTQNHLRVRLKYKQTRLFNIKAK